MIKVAVTGGICGGKTTMCKYIESKGYKVYYSDNIAKELVYTNENLRKKLVDEFGDETFINGKYNTKYIANIVFNDDKRLNTLDSIFSSFMDDAFDKICEENKKEDIFFYESALIHKHKKEHNFDYIINAYVFFNVALERLMKRNNLSSEEATIRLKSQLKPYELAIKSNISINTNTNNWKERVDKLIINLLNN